MSAMEHVVRYPLVMEIGGALIHFLWQGAAIALVCCVALHALRGRSANARYVVVCVSLAVMGVLPLLTFGLLAGPANTPYRGAPPSAYAAGMTMSSDSVLSLLPASAQPEISPGSVPPLLGWIVVVWLAGVALLSLHTAVAWVGARRLGRRATRPVSAALQGRVAELSIRMGIRRSPALRESDAVLVPCVIGWSRCVVLLPVAVVTQMPPAHLEALIAHELAHVRRHDYLVNLLQTAVETLLFYHPAVWWVSSRIRTEREICCDDLAVQVVRDPITYARALATLEEMRSPRQALAMAGNGGNLMYRIRRLTGSPSHGPSTAPGWLAAGILFTVLMAVVGVTRLQASPQETPSKRPAVAARTRAAGHTPLTRSSAAQPAPARTSEPDSAGIIIAEEAPQRPVHTVAAAAPAKQSRPALAPARPADVTPARAASAAEVASGDDVLSPVQAEKAAGQDRAALEAEKRALEAERDALRAARQDQAAKTRVGNRAAGRDRELQERELRAHADVARKLDRQHRELLHEHQRMAEQERQRAQDVLRAGHRDPLVRRRLPADEASTDLLGRIHTERNEMMAQIMELRRRIEALERENQRLRRDDRRPRPGADDEPFTREERAIREQVVLQAQSRLDVQKDRLAASELEMMELRQQYADKHPVVLQQRRKIDQQTAIVKREQQRLEALRRPAGSR
jgi:beta-lactamase regulating signal transducer with metallopeptidase domain